MAVKTLQNFNRIINLTFYNSLGLPHRIKCPTKGRKPNITINGNFTTASYLPAFNVTIKNFYMNMQGDQYKKLKVEAGYEGNTIEFEGTILSMYQEAPGPEGSTVIQCQQGKLQNYLDATVQMDYMPGTLLKVVLADLSKKLGTYGVHTGVRASTLTLTNRIQFDGSVREAMEKLEQEFVDKQLNIFVRNNTLCAICLTTGDFVKSYTLEYMSAPPQENSGDQEGTYYTTVTAPWIPKLQKGDLLVIPSRVYMRNFTLVGGLKKTQTVQVTSLQFHFATTGGTNSMTVQGFLKR